MSTAPNIKSSRIIKATPFFYGWVILATGTISIVMIGPSQTFTVGVFLDSFIDELGISRSTISLIYGVATFSASLLLPKMGRLIDHYGPRLLLLLIALALGLSSIGMSMINGAITMFVGFLALRFLGFGSLQLASNNIIAQWFIRRRGLAMGFAGLSLPISLIIYPRLTQYLIDEFAWRGAWIILGLLVWLIILPMGWFLFKDKPEQYGLQPDGDSPMSDKDQLTNSQNLPHNFEENWTLDEAKSTGAFWVFAAALSTMTLLMAGLVFHHISLFEVRGIDRDTAINTFNVVAIFAVIANLSMGRLLDKFSARRMMALTLGLLIAAILLVQVMTTPTQAFIYALLIGLASGNFRVIDSVVWAKYYGRLNLGVIKGATMIGVIGSTALGPYPLGVSLDYFGSYSPALMALLTLPLSITVALFFIKRPEKQHN